MDSKKNNFCTFVIFSPLWCPDSWSISSREKWKHQCKASGFKSAFTPPIWGESSVEIELAVNSNPHRHSRRKKEIEGCGASLIPPSPALVWSSDRRCYSQSADMQTWGVLTCLYTSEDGEWRGKKIRVKKSTSLSFWVKTVKQSKESRLIIIYKWSHREKPPLFQIDFDIWWIKGLRQRL